MFGVVWCNKSSKELLAAIVEILVVLNCTEIIAE